MECHNVYEPATMQARVRQYLDRFHEAACVFLSPKYKHRAMHIILFSVLIFRIFAKQKPLEINNTNQLLLAKLDTVYSVLEIQRNEIPSKSRKSEIGEVNKFSNSRNNDNGAKAKFCRQKSHELNNVLSKYEICSTFVR